MMLRLFRGHGATFPAYAIFAAGSALVACVAAEAEPVSTDAFLPESAADAAVDVDGAAIAQPAVLQQTAPGADTGAVSDDADQIELGDADLVCLAKIVHHESANQTDAVQLAVANVVLNRTSAPSFPRTVCAVGAQRGQFFNLNGYHPYSDPRWNNSLRIAKSAIEGEGGTVAPGALFFHSAGYTSRFFQGRPRVGQRGDLVFYR